MDARWRVWELSHDGYVGSTVPDQQTPWMSMPGFDYTRALYDWMHCCHLGVCRDVIAQLLRDYCRFHYQGPERMEEQLRSLWLRFRVWRKRHKVPSTKRKFTLAVIGLSSESESTYPELSSRVKAAHMKPLVYFLADLWRTAPPPHADDIYYDLRKWCIYGLAATMFVFDTGGIKLSSEAIAKAKSSGQRFFMILAKHGEHGP